MGKVAQKREEKIKAAAAKGDWTEVKRLLQQAFNNQERKNRRYGLLSLNYTYEIGDGDSGDKVVELMDFLPSPEPTPEEIIIVKEIHYKLYNAISQLPEVDQQILYEYFFEGKNYSQISKIIPLSDKTVKRHLEKSLIVLHEKLQEFGDFSD